MRMDFDRVDFKRGWILNVPRIKFYCTFNQVDIDVKYALRENTNVLCKNVFLYFSLQNNLFDLSFIIILIIILLYKQRNILYFLYYKFVS